MTQNEKMNKERAGNIMQRMLMMLSAEMCAAWHEETYGLLSKILGGQIKVLYIAENGEIRSTAMDKMMQHIEKTKKGSKKCKATNTK